PDWIAGDSTLTALSPTGRDFFRRCAPSSTASPPSSRKWWLSSADMAACHRLLPGIPARRERFFWRSRGGLGERRERGHGHLYLSIQGQRYDASGSPLGDSFQINAYTTREREVPLSRAIPRGLGQVALGFSIFESRPTALEAPL